MMTDIDTDRIDEAVLALMYLGLHGESRAWKGFDWDALKRLHTKGFISSPVGNAKSVILTEEGLREARRLFHELFAAVNDYPPTSRCAALTKAVAFLSRGWRRCGVIR